MEAGVAKVPDPATIPSMYHTVDDMQVMLKKVPISPPVVVPFIKIEIWLDPLNRASKVVVPAASPIATPPAIKVVPTSVITLWLELVTLVWTPKLKDKPITGAGKVIVKPAAALNKIMEPLCAAVKICVVV